MMNRYLEDKAREMDMRRKDMDMRRNRMYDNRSSMNNYMPNDMRNDMRRDYYPDQAYHGNQYDGGYGIQNRGVFAYDNVRNPYYNDHNYHGDYNYQNDYKMVEDEYKKDLDEWIEKLQRHDRIGLKEHQVIENARQMGVKFDKYDEKEFYAIYLMIMSDHKSLGNDYQKIIKQTIEWLEDDDVKHPYSEKVCAYLDSVVLGKK